MYAAKCQSYAKALHYKESEFLSEPLTTATIDALIGINNLLQQVCVFVNLSLILRLGY